jgi:hypothetical protein
MKVGQIKELAFCLAILGAGATFLSACDSSQDKQAMAAMGQERTPAHSIQRCLDRHGARKADSMDDLDFLARAEEKDDVDKPGFIYDKAASIVVHVWTGSSFEGRPAPWMIWIGQPFGEERTPEEIVVERPKKSYVMYVTSSSKRRQAERCLHF